MREELSDENIISKDNDGLGEGGVVMVQGQVDDPFVENRIGEDVDQEDLPLSNRETEEVEGDFIGRGVEDGGHGEMEGACLMEHLISFTSQSYPCWYQTASTCPSNPGWSFVVPT